MGGRHPRPLYVLTSRSGQDGVLSLPLASELRLIMVTESCKHRGKETHAGIIYTCVVVKTMPYLPDGLLRPDFESISTSEVGGCDVLGQLVIHLTTTHVCRHERYVTT